MKTSVIKQRLFNVVWMVNGKIHQTWYINGRKSYVEAVIRQLKSTNKFTYGKLITSECSQLIPKQSK